MDAAPDPRAQERLGSILHDKWTLERLLGVGGMGAVYAARHRNGARAAVKVLSPQAGRTPHIRKRFLHEGYAANRVDHPGAVKVLDDDVIGDGPDEGTAYLVMELLEGESLHERAKREPPLGERELLEIADGVLAVLEAAHAHGVVHRDLKPDNLFLVGDEGEGGRQVKVLDFGLARLLETQEQTLAGMAVGTPTYMSPEQAAGHVDKIDGRTDLYALGSILFQLATRQRIHDAAHTLGLVIRMATTPAPKIATVAAQVSPAFARIVDRALEFQREDRYQSAAAMRADVRAALDGSLDALAAPAPASGPTPSERVAEIAAAETVVASPVALARKADAASEISAHDESLPPIPRSGSLLRTAFFFAVVGVGGYIGWERRADIGGLLASANASATALGTPSPSAPPSESASTAAVSSSGSGAASASAAPPPAEPDAAPAVDLDAGPPDDAAAGDGGEDDEEEEDDEPDAALPAPPITSSSNGVRRPVPASARPTARPARPAARPGHTPKKKKKWHW